ncbi:MAG: Uncharacterised protein [Crocinitomicaceae bacterium]|nr:MAG: Uncharacterised protein [Crocinitomicaceae bacterium]
MLLIIVPELGEKPLIPHSKFQELPPLPPETQDKSALLVEIAEAYKLIGELQETQACIPYVLIGPLLIGWILV